MWVREREIHLRIKRLLAAYKNHEQAHLAILYNVCYNFVYELHKLINKGEIRMVALIAVEPAAHISEWVESESAYPLTEQQEQVETNATLEQHTLVARALQGDRDAFNEIVDQYSGLMLRTAYMIVKDRDIAEDAVQDALIQAWQHLPSLREARALRSWLMRIVVNQCISFKRRLARSSEFIRQSLAEQETDFVSQVAGYYEGYLERNWDLAHAIEHLPAKQQTVIALHYYQGMTLPEMSQTLRISENTLKKRIQAALRNLRQVLRSIEMDEALAGLQDCIVLA
jgi:RNA polymerase sigma-70 factor, ECF subfamily